MARPKGGYKTKDGKRVIGVTTVTGRFKDSGGLLWWAFEQGKAAERGEIDSLYDKRDEAGDAGTLAHDMVESYVKFADPPDLSNYTDEVIRLGTQGFENFKTWKANSRIEILEQEVPLVSEVYRYGGCLDAIGKDSTDQLCLLDWKTGGIYVEQLLQIRAYKQLWEEENPDKPLTGGFHLCRFAKEHADFSHHFWSELDDAWSQFKLLRKAYDLDKLLKKRVK